MMKKCLCILFAGILFAYAALFSVSAYSEITFAPDDTVTSAPSGYPRLNRFDDGTLVFVNSGAVRTSRDGGRTWVRHTLTNGLANTYTSSTSTEHTLSRENWQGFVMPDGRLMVTYRARTAGSVGNSQEFYTSIRARIFTSTPDEYMNGAKSLTYTDEVVVVEALATGFHGFWEPFVVQIDDDTLALYYADDYSVSKPASQQNIAYKLYTLSTGTWSESAYVAINGASRSSRDGMPVVTTLADGSFAMVFEAFDYNWRSYNGTYGKSVFVISLSRSTDGKTWSTPVPIAAPQNITAGRRCAAPFITTLPDGRIAVSYMTDDLYVGTITDEYDRARCCNSMLIVSNAPVTNTSAITATTGGVSSTFTSLGTPIAPVANGYQIWTSVSAFEGDLYFATSAGTNDGSVASSTQIRYAAVDPAMPIITAEKQDGDGSVLVSITKTSAGDGYKYYRAVGDGEFALIATTTATSYTDTAIAEGLTYTYKVTSYRGSTESEASAAHSVTATDTLCSHSYDDGVVTVPPTCTAVGTRTCTCTLCGGTGTFDIPTVAHTYGAGVVTAAPEVGVRGEMTYTCTVCGDTTTEEIPSIDETTLTQTSVSEGDDFDEISARAGEKEFTLIILSADAENGAVAGMVTLPATASYIYRKNGVYLTPVRAEESEDGLCFAANAGEQVVYSTASLVLFGDVNADNRLTLSDVLRGFRYLAGQAEGIDYAASDMSGDCNIGLLDFLLTLRQILNG